MCIHTLTPSIIHLSIRSNRKDTYPHICLETCRFVFNSAKIKFENLFSQGKEELLYNN